MKEMDISGISGSGIRQNCGNRWERIGD